MMVEGMVGVWWRYVWRNGSGVCGGVMGGTRVRDVGVCEICGRVW